MGRRINMQQRIKDALTQVFQQAQIELDELPGGRFSGLVIWDGFANDDSVERQRRVRQALVNALNGDATSVGILFAYTPHELKVMRAA